MEGVWEEEWTPEVEVVPTKSLKDCVPILISMDVVESALEREKWEHPESIRQAHELLCCKEKCCSKLSLNDIYRHRLIFHAKDSRSAREWMTTYISALSKNGQRHYQLGSVVIVLPLSNVIFPLIKKNIRECV